MWDISRLLEQWACAKAKGSRTLNTLSMLQKECSAIINGTLSMFFFHLTSPVNSDYLTETVSQSRQALMNYPNYDTKVIDRYQTKLVGWTYREFKSPFDIHAIDDVRILLEALQCGSCHWVRMTKTDMSHHKAEIVKRKANGETVGTARKSRSDKGTKRRKSAPGAGEGVEVNEDGPGPAKKQKKGKAPTRTTKKPTKKSKKNQLPPVRPTSKEFVESDDAVDTA
jgi:hypothetical protein